MEGTRMGQSIQPSPVGPAKRPRIWRDRLAGRAAKAPGGHSLSCHVGGFQDAASRLVKLANGRTSPMRRWLLTQIDCKR